MALHIRNPEIDALVVELQRLTGAPTKASAVEAALEGAVMRARNEQSVSSKLSRAKAMADQMGSNQPGFNVKAFLDENWEL